MLEVKQLNVQYGPLTILQDINFRVEPNQWVMIVGPNGAGKSTLVNAIIQGTPYTGTVYFKGQNVAAIKPGKLAKLIGMLMQSHHVGYSFSVEEVVKLGRYAYSQGIFSSTSDEDNQKIEKALELTGMQALRSQSVLTLSGGELQRTFLAQLLAQDPQLLILDEPANHLDLVYQKLVFELINQWVKQTGRAVISVVHDLSLAKAFGTHAVLLNNGRITAAGVLDKVLTKSNLDAVYDMDVFHWMHTMLGQWDGAGSETTANKTKPPYHTAVSVASTSPAKTNTK